MDMKIVCISDTHGQYPDNVPDGDILIHAGDITKYGEENERCIARKHRVDIILCK